jgi:hypothetical protein
MTDIDTVELFVAGGRAVASTGVYSNSSRVALATDGPALVLHAQGWVLAATQATVL